MASAITAAAALSARSDYFDRDRLSWRTQWFMWAAYLLGGAVIVRDATEAAVRGTRTSRFVGAMLSCTGFALFIAGARPFSSFAQLAGRETGGLITGGIYAYSRNPQYLANLLLSGGSALAGRSLSGGAVTAAAAAAYSSYLPAEEAHLERTFGDDYRRYRERAPRWIGLRSLKH